MKNIDELRGEIDVIDDRMANLFADRMVLAAEIAKAKQESGTVVLHRAREEAILRRLSGQVEKKWVPALRQLYETMFRLSRAHQEIMLSREPSPLRRSIEDGAARAGEHFPTTALVACQGIEEAYSHIAARQLFQTPQTLFLRTFEAVFQAVEQRLCTYGVLPIENSTYGSVTQVYDLLKRHNCRIVRGVRLQIDHCLLSPAKSVKDIREIFSHEQALGQCSAFLDQLPANVAITACENTAVAARMAAQSGREDVAAISSESCAKRYNLKILKKNLQNEARNETRFICIAPQLEIYPNANKCAVLLTLRHEPGTLAALLQLPAALSVNLTKLETRPDPGKDFAFLFCLELESNAATPESIDFLEQMEQLSESFALLGSYRELGVGEAG
ncbi:MAG: chorismate mutase [Oscillospiraceae bacterium]|nr:chorismate mutase [Oscillospiraceae bacterium]